MKYDLKQLLLHIDDDLSKWPEHRKRPEASPIKHRPKDFLSKDTKELGL